MTIWGRAANAAPLGFVASFAAVIASMCLCGVALAGGDVNLASCSPETEGSPGFRAYLPDCRAYELVSPPYIGGQHLKTAEQQTASAPPMSANGEHVLAQDYGGFAEAGNVENNNLEYGAIYEFSRTPSGWNAEALEPPASEYPEREFTDIASRNLNRTLWNLFLPAHSGEELPPPGQVEVHDGVYAIREAVGNGTGRFTLVGPAAAPGVERRPPGDEEPEGIVGASAELTHILFLEPKAGGAAWPGDETLEGGQELYEYEGSGSDEREPVLVGVSNEASLSAEAAREGKPHINEAAKLVSRCGSTLGGYGISTVTKAISASGAIVYFTALHETTAGQECTTPAVNELYARVNGSETVKISGAQAAKFWGASEDGSKVLFTEGESLYEYDFDAPVGARVSLVADPVTGTPVISDDGSRVYFTSPAELTSEPNGNGETAAQASGEKLYVYDAEPGGGAAFVGGEAELLQTTRDGQFALLRSPTHFSGTNDASTVPQLFEYDAETGFVARVSIGQQGAVGYECEATHVVEEGYDCDGNATTSEPRPAQSIHELNVDHPFGATSGLSVAADGTVVFTSEAPLAPGAVVGGENVYEYRAGDVYLIAAGDESLPLIEQHRLFGISADGADVFFVSTNSLVPQDMDTQSSWYDAREEGGFPGLASLSACSGEACQGAPSTPPGLPVAGGSAVTPAGGNALPPALAKSKPKSAAQVRAEKLANALKSCRAKHNKLRRRQCERIAHKDYGPPAAHKATRATNKKESR